MKAESGKWHPEGELNTLKKEKNAVKRVERLPKAVASLSTFLFALSAMLSCSNDMKDIQQFQRQAPPDQEIVDAHIWRSEEGKLQMELDAPRIVQYRKPDTRTIYPKGVELRFYNGQRQLQTFIRADKATSYDDKNIITAKDSVVVIDYDNGDTIYLEDIVWKSDEDIIYSNHPVRAVNGNRVTYGDGFVRDANMTNMRITHKRGIIEFEE
jgi:LPS export ABC transporter protein LptC